MYPKTNLQLFSLSSPSIGFTKPYTIYLKKKPFKGASTSRNICLKMVIVKEQYARKVL